MSDQRLERIVAFFKSKPYLASFLWALGIYLSILCVFKTYFQFPDDTVISMMFNGAGLNNTPTEYNQSENILFSLVLKNLYLHFKGVQWYTLALTATQVLSIWAIFAAFQLSSYPLFKSLFFVAGTAVTTIHLFAEIEWTRTAGVAAVGGFILLFVLWQRSDSKHLMAGLVMSFSLLTLSSLIRFPALVLITLISIPAIIYFYQKETNKHVRWAVIGTLIFSGILALGTHWYDHAYYFKDPNWAATLRLFELQRGLLDYRDLVFNETTKPIYDSIGWTSNTLDLFKSWYFIDKDTFSAEKLQILKDHFPSMALNKNGSESIAELFSNAYAQMLSLLLLTLFFFLPKRVSNFMVISTLWTFMVLLACHIFLKVPERVFLPCLFMQSSLGLLLATPDLIKERSSPTFKFALFSLAALLVLSVVSLQQPYSKNRLWQIREAELRTIVQKLDPQQDQLYVLWSWLYPYQEIGAFEDYDLYRRFNIVAITWCQRSPMTQAMLDRFGIRDFSRDIVDNPKVRLICAPVQFNLYKAYVKEKYGLEVVPQVLFMSNQFPVIAVRSAGKIEGRVKN